MVTSPAVLLSTNLPGTRPPTATRMHDLLVAVARERGTAIVAVTHSRALASLADRVLTLDDGVLHPAGALEGLA